MCTINTKICSYIHTYITFKLYITVLFIFISGKKYYVISNYNIYNYILPYISTVGTYVHNSCIYVILYPLYVCAWNYNIHAYTYVYRITMLLKKYKKTKMSSNSLWGEHVSLSYKIVLYRTYVHTLRDLLSLYAHVYMYICIYVCIYVHNFIYVMK